MTENEIIKFNGGDCNDEERVIIVEGYRLPPTSEPPAYTFSDLDNEGIRSFTDGRLKRNRIRANIMSISLKWDLLDIGTVLKIFSAVSKPEFSVSVFDRTQGKRVTKTMYASADKQWQEQKLYSLGYLSSLSFSLIEC